MIDPELEKKNFIHAGQIWSPSLLQIHQRSGGERNSKEVPRMEKQSYSRIGIFFFFLQIAKCLNENCCRPSELFKNCQGKVPSSTHC